MIKILQPRMAEIGKIKIGGKGELITSSAGKKFALPKKYDHFVITTNSKNDKGEFIVDEKIMLELGTTPKEIDIVLLFDDIEKNFRTSLSLYAGRKCWCRGDGEKAERLVEIKNDKNEVVDHEKKAVACPCDNLDVENGEKTKCKPSGILICLLPQAQRIGGVYCFRTSSWNSIRNMLTSMVFIRQISNGILSGLPLKMTIKPQSVQTKEGKNHIIFVTNIEFDGDMNYLRKTAIDIAKTRATSQIELNKYVKQALEYLATPETEEEQEDVNAEFYHENLDKKPEEKKPEPAQQSGAKKEEVDKDDDIPPEGQENIKSPIPESSPLF